jgi:hypothetical protein
VHLEAVAHAPVTRSQLRSAGDLAGIAASRLRIPADGETVTFELAETRGGEPAGAFGQRKMLRGRWTNS